MDCLTAELARLTDIVKEMEKRKVIARKTNGERPTENMTCRKVIREKVREEKEGGTRGQEIKRRGCDRRKDEMRVDVTKRKSITSMLTGRKEAVKKGTTEKAAGGKSATREIQNGGATLKQ